MSKFIFVDVEATGRSPIKGTMTEFGAVDYKTRQIFHGVIWEGKPDPKNPAVPIIVGTQIKPLQEVMNEFAAWLDSLGKGRPIFVSDNPAYDYQWINAAFDACDMDNPFGHSARRIGDFWAGIQRNWGSTQSWKSFRVTPHDHNPVNDSMGNVEAFEKIMNIAKSRTYPLETVTRFEAIDHTKEGTGRALVMYDIQAELSFQNDNKTLKVFLSDRDSKDHE